MRRPRTNTGFVKRARLRLRSAFLVTFPLARLAAVAAVALSLVLLGCALLAPAAANAAAGVAIAPSFPSPLTVGAMNVPASIVVTNVNTAPDGSLALCNVGDAGSCTGSEGITLLPSCGGQDFTLACNASDPGVFNVDTPAIGAAGSACQGKQFTVAVANAISGKVRFTPTVGQVELPVAGSSCRIDFTVDVLSLPDIDRAPATAGLQTAQVAETLAVSDQALVAFARAQSAGVTVKAAPSIATTASPGVPIGGHVSDAATLQDEYNPAGGSVTFSLYGPGDATCSGAVAFTTTVAITAEGTAGSGDFVPTAAGTYRWVASYAGDAINNAAAAACNGAGGTVVVAKASPSIATTASAGVVLGGQVTDSATLGAEHNPASGSVMFRLYGPGDTTCAGAPVFTSTPSVAADGTATSLAFEPDGAGTYRWVASYTGDANNDPAAGACNDAGETVVVAKASPSIVTTASGGVTIGGQVTDSATLVGEHNAAAGSVTFQLYGPADAGCSGAPAFSSTVAIEADGTATSAPATPTATGTYRWIAIYGGDANNTAASGACNDPGETVTIAKASPSLVTLASPGVAIGGHVTASATLAGEHAPTTGSVAFRLYGPGDTTCTSTPALTSTVPIGADGTATSGALTPPAPGTYRWIAVYGGDASNDPASNACNGPLTTVVVTKATPSIATSASGSVALEGQITDAASLGGEFGPTAGSVTFRLYADASCVTAVFASAVAIGADGTATSAAFTPTAPGTYRWIATYDGDANNEGAAGGCNDPDETVTVTKRSPAMTTNASPDRTIGALTTDSATLVGEHNATAGSVTFSLYGPGDAACSGTPAFSSTVAIASDGTVTSAPFAPSIAGTYRWIAGYGGDANNHPAAAACNDAGETVVIAKATPSILTTASADITIGAKLTDAATLTGEHNPAAGSITFRLYGPGDAACSGAPAFTATNAIEPDGSVTSSEFTPSLVGTYRWIASYGGDANNHATAGACNDAGETVAVTRRTPTLASNASAPVAVGDTITDTASLTNVLNATGDVTFRLYGPGDETCSGTPLRSSTVAVGSGNTATSAPYATSAPGTYRWVASYGGDANHAPAAGACNDPNESVTVTKARPSIDTNASDAVAVAGHVTDSATLAGAFGPTTGSVTFRLYGPQDAACTAAAVFASTVSIAADGSATSQAFSPSAPGTYRWVASYAGDANNDAASGACDDPRESVTVAKASPSIATNASPAVAVGGTIADSATLGGQYGATHGSVTFRLYAPGDASCSGAPVFQSVVAIGADGTATSAPFTARAAGTYHWIASYGGDGANAPAAGACNDPAETVIVGTASPTITTNASAAVDVGGAVTDTATLDGEVNPTTGSVTFRLYGPGNASCTAAPLFESRVAIRADGTASSAPFQPTAPGTYRWIAAYSGDPNNRAAIGACNDDRESVTVRIPPSPLLCGGTKIALVDVFPEGSRMIISGVAQPSLAGKRARIVRESTNKTIISARIGANGAFAASAALPAKRLRAGARYRAIVDRSRSAALKLVRRSYLTRAAIRGNKATFRGRVTGDFKAGAKVTLLQIDLCTKNTAIAATKLSRSGRWQVSIPLPTNALNVLFRAKTNVLRDARPHRTFTLPRPLSLSSAPSR